MVEHNIRKVIEGYKDGSVTPSSRYQDVVVEAQDGLDRILSEQQQLLRSEQRQARRLVSMNPKPNSKNIVIDL